MNTDILLADDGDLLILNGDLVIGDSNNQHVASIFEAFKGEIRENVELGFGAAGYLKTNFSTPEVKRNLRVELNRDGYQNTQIQIDNQSGELNITIE